MISGLLASALARYIKTPKVHIRKFDGTWCIAIPKGMHFDDYRVFEAAQFCARRNFKDRLNHATNSGRN